MRRGSTLEYRVSPLGAPDRTTGTTFSRNSSHCNACIIYMDALHTHHVLQIRPPRRCLRGPGAETIYCFIIRLKSGEWVSGVCSLSILRCARVCRRRPISRYTDLIEKEKKRRRTRLAARRGVCCVNKEYLLLLSRVAYVRGTMACLTSHSRRRDYFVFVRRIFQSKCVFIRIRRYESITIAGVSYRPFVFRFGARLVQWTPSEIFVPNTVQRAFHTSNILIDYNERKRLITQ